MKVGFLGLLMFIIYLYIYILYLSLYLCKLKLVCFDMQVEIGLFKCASKERFPQVCLTHPMV